MLRPSDIVLYDFIKGKTENSHCRIEDRLSCHICYCYKYLDTSNGYLPECRLFNCYHFYHRDCLEHWKKFQLKHNDGTVKPINCTLCKSVVGECYVSLYACEWKIDTSGIKISSGTMIELIDLEDVEETNTPNFKEKNV